MENLGDGYARSIPAHTPLWMHVLNCLNYAFGVKRPNKRRFPGPLPVSLSRSDIPSLFFGSYDYALTWKSDGERCAVVFTTFQMMPICVYVNRALKMLLVPMDVPSFLTQTTTVFDGEIVNLTTVDGHERFLFETIDIPMVMNCRIRHLHYAERLQYGVDIVDAWRRSLAATAATEDDDLSAFQNAYAHPLIAKHKIAGGSDILFLRHERRCFDFSIKPIFCIQSFRLVIENLVPLLLYPVDGACLTAMQAMLRPMHCPDIKKWKWKNTLEFKFVRASLGVLDAFPWAPALEPHLGGFYNVEFDRDQLDQCGDREGGFFLLVCDGFMDNLAIFSYQRNPAGSKVPSEQLDGRVVECFIDTATMEWVPETVRSDRGYPNSHFTVNKTLGNIVEGVSYMELACDKDTVFHPEYVSPMSAEYYGDSERSCAVEIPPIIINAEAN